MNIGHNFYKNLKTILGEKEVVIISDKHPAFFALCSLNILS